MTDASSSDPKIVHFPGKIRGEHTPSPPLKGTGPGGTSGDMEARVARLESDMAHVKDTLKSLDSRTEAVRIGVETIRVDLVA